MKKYNSGFTLIELLIVLTIAGILAAIAAPSFTSSIKKNRAETQLRNFTNQLKVARSEAVTEQRSVTICTLDAGTCNVTGTVWSDGWTIFFDDDEDGVLEDAPNDTIKVTEAIGGFNKLTVRDAGATDLVFIRFNPRGSVSSSATVKICDRDNDASYARAVLIGQSGMVFRSALDSATGYYQDINGNDLVCP